MTKPRRLTKRIHSLRTETQRQRLCRLLFAGMRTEKIARLMRCSTDTVRDLIATPEFQILYAAYERQQLARVDRALPRLLTEAMDALVRLLRHKDWRAKEAALSRIMTLHGPLLEKFVARLHERQEVHPTGTIIGVPLDDMTDEQRNRARELLQLMRDARPPRALPDRLQQPPTV